MKRKDLVKMVVGIILVVLLVIAYNKFDMEAVKDWFANLTTTEKTEVVTDDGSQQDTPTVAPTENTVATTPEPTEKPSSFVDSMGKTYFYDKGDAYRGVISLQARLDLAAMEELNVYDVMRANDVVVVDSEGKQITADYGIDLSAAETVAIFRDGYNVLSYNEDEEKFHEDDSFTHTFKGASDSLFTDAVFCDKDAAIKSRVCIGYVNAKILGTDKEYGCKGWFKMNLLEDRIFKAFVLVKRAVVFEGNTQEVFTWVIRTCDGEPEQPANDGNGGNGGGKPSDKPTAEPTAEPTVEPTVKPTAEPTIEPTVKPTHSPTEAPRPTHSPTEAPTAAPTEAPTKEPTEQPSYKPTPVPEVTPEPTNRHSDTGDGGSGNNHSPVDDDTSTDEGTSGGNRHSDPSDTGSGNRHSEP